MDRIRIKETSRELLKKNHWLCVGVAFLSVLSLGGAGASFSASSELPSQSAGDFSFQMPEITPTAIIFAVVFAFIMIFALASSIAATVFVTNQFKVGSCRFFLKYRKNHPVKVEEIFQSYKDKTFLNIAKVTFIRDLIVGLWSFLFIIPGIIKGYEYFAVDYILSVRPDMDYSSALELSKRIMKGHKGELFELEISYIGWYMLSLFTCGLLSLLYVNPYRILAETEFFSYVREDAIYRGIIAPFDIPDYDAYIPQPPAYTYYNPNFVNPQTIVQTGIYNQPEFNTPIEPMAQETNENIITDTSEIEESPEKIE